MGMQMLKLHWKAARWPMLPVLVAAFGLPMWTGRSAWGATYTIDSFWECQWETVGESARPTCST